MSCENKTSGNNISYDIDPLIRYFHQINATLECETMALLFYHQAKDKDIAYLKDKAKDKDIIIGCNNIFTPEDRVTICFNQKLKVVNIYSNTKRILFMAFEFSFNIKQVKAQSYKVKEQGFKD